MSPGPTGIDWETSESVVVKREIESLGNAMVVVKRERESLGYASSGQWAAKKDTANVRPSNDKQEVINSIEEQKGASNVDKEHPCGKA